MAAVTRVNKSYMASLTRPKVFFLTAAFVSFLLSVGLWFSGHREAGVFVGIWVPSICSAGALILSRGLHD